MPTQTEIRLADLAPARRLAIGLFLASLLGFYALAQVKVVTAVAGPSGGYPGPEEILIRYHGDPTQSRFHRVLDPDLPSENPKSMFGYAGVSEAEKIANRLAILAWVEGGAPREGWRTVEPVFTGEKTCGQCHNATRTDIEGRPLPKADLPFETYEQVFAASGRDTGMSVHDLATSSHNHMWGFASVAFVTSMLFTFTRWRGPLRVALIVGAFAGAVLDVSSWWLTHDHGSPFQWGVLAGGGLFGACVLTMAVLTLDEVWWGGALGRFLAPVLRRLGLRGAGPFDAPGT